MKPIASRPHRYRISIARHDITAREIAVGANRATPGALNDEIATPGAFLTQVRADIEEMQLRALTGTDGSGGPAEAGPAAIRELGNRNEPRHTLIARLDPKAKAELERRYGGTLKILDDEIRLELLGQPRGRSELSVQWSVAEGGQPEPTLKVSVVVTTSSGLPLEGATVEVEGALWSDIVVTDSEGLARLELLGESTDTLELLRVNGPGHWDRRIESPVMREGEHNAISLVTFGALADSEVTPWGVEALGTAGSEPTGRPVKVAIVDTGIDVEHSDLSVNAAGLMTSETGSGRNGLGWLTDEMGHGTHVAGTIAALVNGQGVHGVAGGAVEIYSLKIFPSPRISSLIEAVDWCIDHDIDLINLSVGVDADDAGMEEAMARARDAGCVPIAAAGNTGGRVLSPARLGDVVAVSAVGDRDRVQAGSSHASWLEDPADERAAEGLAPARFTCRGEEIDLCAPGVGILSTVPGGAWAAKDGTSMACPHVVGVAARLLADRADIWSMDHGRTRSDAIVALLMGSATSVGLPSQIQGAGMPRLGPVDDPGHPPGCSQEKTAIDELFDAFLKLVGERLRPYSST